MSAINSSNTNSKAIQKKLPSKIEIFTDGSLKKSTGSWSFVIVKNNKILFENSGREKNTTCNRMELQAAIEALKILPPNSKVRLYSDSRVLIDAFTIPNMQPLPDMDLIKAIEELIQTHKISWNWVKAHSGNIYNERCDELCAIARGN